MKSRNSIVWSALLLLLVSRLVDRCTAEVGNSKSLLARHAEDPEGTGEDIDDEFDGIEDYEDEYEEGKPKETIAQIIDEALKEEFKHEEEKQAEVGKQFNETVSRDEGTKETVVIISQKKEKERDKERAANRTATADEEARTGVKSTTTDPDIGIFDGNTDYAATNDTDSADKKSSHMDMNVEADVDRIIDSHDNEYVLSKPNEEGSMGLTLDPQLIRDLSTLIATAALGGLAMESMGQPTINGYFVAGSLIGPGGANWVKEIVQVQSMAQLGIQFLLFTLGLELSMAKLRIVRDVALIGGLLQIALSAALGAAGAAAIGLKTYHGAFVGALVAMSSTSVVVKCLHDARQGHQPHAQITMGTLVLQDCVVGLLFAFMPVLANAASGSDGISAMVLLSVGWRVLAKLALAFAVAAAAAVLVMPTVARAVSKFSSETFQISVLGFCLATAVATTKLGISAELGAFIAGVVLAATEHQEAALSAAEPVAHLFLALFIASTGLTIAPSFMAEHILVLAAGVAVLITAKTLLIAGVVLAFRYPADTALAVGINLAQIGEFGFVLMSIANQQGLIGSQVYLLLMGITALSLLLTPFLLQISTRLIPRVKGNAAGSDVELANLISSPSGKESPATSNSEANDETGLTNSWRGSDHLARRPTPGWQKRRTEDDGVEGGGWTPPSATSADIGNLTPSFGAQTTHRRTGHSRTSSGDHLPGI